MLVAEVGGEMRAAISISNGYAISNPFEPSSDLINLLRARADQLLDDGRAEVNRGRSASVFSFGWLRGPHRSQAR